MAEPIQITPVDSKSPVPLYYQVESDLRRLIDSGGLKPGDPVPPEHELCRRYDVSRQTMRMALSRLVEDELISRTAGRGTFVMPRSARSKFYLDRSFTQQMTDMGRSARSRVLDTAIDTVHENDGEALRQYIGAECFRLARLRIGNDEPVGIQYATILTSSCPGIEEFDFETESLYDVLATQFEFAIREIRHAVTAVLAGKQEASLLDVKEGAALLAVDTTAFLMNDEVIEYTTSLYRTDRYAYRTRHTF